MDESSNLETLLPRLLNEILQGNAKMSINSAIQANFLENKINGQGHKGNPTYK